MMTLTRHVVWRAEWGLDSGLLSPSLGHTEQEGESEEKNVQFALVQE